MARYSVEYTCGHAGDVYLSGKHTDREWKLEREKDKLCPDCWKEQVEKERKLASEKNAAENAEAGLPTLEGTEKQIAWAETIRSNKIKETEEFLNKNKDRILEDKKELLEKSFNSLKKHQQAHWWIEKREEYAFDLLEDESKKIQKEATVPPAAVIEEQKQTVTEAKFEATVYPENKKTEIIAEIRMNGDVLEVSSAKDENIIEVNRKSGLKWDGKNWSRKLVPINGKSEDRMAEVGNNLLAAGVPVRIYNPEIRQKAISGEFEPECKTWIYARTKGDYVGYFGIHWSGSENYYEAAKRIHGAKWDKPYMVVPPENFEEVVDFAEKYGFKFTKTGKELIEKSRQEKENALIVKVEKKQKTKEILPETKPSKLEIPQEVVINDEFKD